jgi:hypothetical protein
MEEQIFHEKPYYFHNAGREFNRFTTDAQLQAQAIPYWIYGEQGGSWIGFYPNVSIYFFVYLFFYPSPTLSNLINWQRC